MALLFTIALEVPWWNFYWIFAPLLKGIFNEFSYYKCLVCICVQCQSGLIREALEGQGPWRDILKGPCCSLVPPGDSIWFQTHCWYLVLIPFLICYLEPSSWTPDPILTIHSTGIAIKRWRKLHVLINAIIWFIFYLFLRYFKMF